MIVVGIDPSLAGTGLALINTLDSLDRVLVREGSRPPKRIPTPGRSPRARTKDKGVTPIWATAERISDLAGRILAHVAEVEIDLAVIEAPSFGSAVGGLTHERGGLYWILACTLRTWGVPLAAVPPRSRALYATGDGAAAKPSVVRDSVPRYQLPTRDDNMVDAFVLAAMGCRALGEPIDLDLDAPHTLALNTVPWPPLKGTP